jgi:hypothetical protein
MAVVDKLRQLFGWGGEVPPPDKPRRSDGLGQMDSQFGYNPYRSYANAVKPPYDRRRRYDIYDEMDELPEISSVLDAYAEDCTQFDREKKASVWVEARDKEDEKILNNMFDRLQVADHIEPIHRDVGKYGDDFAELDIEAQIEGWDWRDPRDIERIENRQGTLVGFEETANLKELVPMLDGATPLTTIQQSTAPTEKQSLSFSYKPWDMVHFRLYRRKREWKQKFRNIYGTSLLAGAERIAKQVKILDDMLMVRRLTKTLDTRVYKIDTGRSTPEEDVMILKRWRNAIKRRPYIDPAGNRFDSPFDPFTFQEDLFWPVREGSASSVEVIPGQPNVSDIMDIAHFRDKEFGALRAPKAYFGFEGDINAKATLSTQDIKWGRACNSLQRAARNGLTRLCQIELALHNRDALHSEFVVKMVIPSVLEDISRLEAMQTFIDVAERMVSLGEHLQLDPDSWRRHVLQTTLCMSTQEVDLFLSPPGLQPLPPLPPENPPEINTDPAPTEEPDEDKRLFEKVREMFSSRFGTTSVRAISEHARGDELPNKEKPFAFYQGKIVPIAFVEEDKEDDEEPDDESDGK